MASQSLPAVAILEQLRGDLLRHLSLALGSHFQGLAQAARAARTSAMLNNSLVKKCILIDGAYNLVRHITAPGANDMLCKVMEAVPVPAPATTTHPCSSSSTAFFQLDSDELYLADLCYCPVPLKDQQNGKDQKPDKDQKDRKADTYADTGTDTGADTSADISADTNAGTSADIGTDTGTDTGPDTSADTSADTNAGTSADTSTDTSADTGTDTSADTSADTGADTSADMQQDDVQLTERAFPRGCLVRFVDGLSMRFVDTAYGFTTAKGTEFEVIGYGYGRFRNHLKIQLSAAGEFGFVETGAVIATA
eukprot:CAMPEP_0204523770 /NCGR_PEP_ID=MMETSP0661-20131031/7017_1 /ASSEMBLY_ACC=CAM_ASM_000606 /TAXON_ID=109239 /ORGANISM="Alexandrium margalefi, Strain AMGDE01CS-322" /LENGTH=308 /DNA_ID=CAMNT_0051529487 /DNA_START=105 /DNA_END=1031 /DNA_ORIENTATION=-